MGCWLKALRQRAAIFVRAAFRNKKHISVSKSFTQIHPDIPKFPKPQNHKMYSRCGTGAAQLCRICGPGAAQMWRRINLQSRSKFGYRQPWKMSTTNTYQWYIQEPALYTSYKCTIHGFCESPVCTNCGASAAQVRPRCGLGAAQFRHKCAKRDIF